jgi:hypothetical protein
MSGCIPPLEVAAALPLSALDAGLRDALNEIALEEHDTSTKGRMDTPAARKSSCRLIVWP